MANLLGNAVIWENSLIRLLFLVEFDVAEQQNCTDNSQHRSDLVIMESHDLHGANGVMEFSSIVDIRKYDITILQKLVIIDGLKQEIV